MSVSIPILQKLERLKVVHDTAKVKSETFQPSKEEQIKLIIKNASSKIVSTSIRKESVKFLFNESLRKANGDEGEVHGARDSNTDGPNSGSNSPGSKSKGKGKKVDTRAQTAPVKKSDAAAKFSLERGGGLKKGGNERGDGQKGVNFGARPQTSYHPSTDDSARKIEFATLLKSTVVNEEFRSEMTHQVSHEAKDVRKVFESVCQSYKGGVCVHFSPQRSMQAVDVSHIEQLEAQRNAPALSSMKLEDLGTVKKRGGMALFIDPTLNTDLMKVTLRVTFTKMISLVEGEEVTKEVTMWSDGNYYGVRLISASSGSSSRERDRDLDASRHSATDGAAVSPPPSRALTRTNTADSGYSFGGTSFGGHAVSGRAGEDEPRFSLPGWQHRAPVFIPASKCVVEIVKDPEVYSKHATTACSLSGLKILAVQCQSARLGVRKLHEYVDKFFLTFTANVSVAGGMTALNLAALHGNLEGVRQLVESGASINARNKGGKYHTALHEAVIGGHADIVAYLLAQGANQLVRDELGFSPLHHACKLGNIAVARILINGPSGKRALLLENSNDQKPIEVCTSSFMRSRIEGAMRKFKVFAPPRVSILDR